MQAAITVTTTFSPEPMMGGSRAACPKYCHPAHFDVKILPPSPLKVKNRTPSHSQSSKYCMGGSCYAKIKVSQDPKEPKMTMGFPEYNSIYAFYLCFQILMMGGAIDFE